jgi:hypothetical protein
MKIWLDDFRPAPHGWRRARRAEEVIRLLKTGRVTEISLDHDLGDQNFGTGYEVLVWLEQEVVKHGFLPPKIKIHTANPAARMRMELAVRSIEKQAELHSHQGKSGR